MYSISLKLQHLKMMLNSSYSTDFSTNTKMIDEIYKTRCKFSQVKNRREKIRRLYGG